MDTIDAILTRRSVRDWSEKDVPYEMLNRILEAGRHAPSPLNSQPWHFVVIKNHETIKELMTYAHHGTFLSHAKVIIVVTVEKKARVDEWLFEHEQHLYSGACALQNMWLTVWNFGLGGCWVTLDEPKTEKILEIPTDQKVIGCLALGYSKAEHHEEVPRKQLSEMVSYEKYGSKEVKK
ncbi:MAG: hypothetical protein A3B70_00610 [Deltaproteobacteria bacterium RIFCSPHIGHO2_02_FULL_40_11]|nr:MAG: hypothetical protein A3B70_00610 [Deltaproteobacteria bacterium RIFCSPHIGHO2_02_FULL_40_11]